MDNGTWLDTSLGYKVLEGQKDFVVEDRFVGIFRFGARNNDTSEVRGPGGGIYPVTQTGTIICSPTAGEWRFQIEGSNDPLYPDAIEFFVADIDPQHFGAFPCDGFPQAK